MLRGEHNLDVELAASGWTEKASEDFQQLGAKEASLEAEYGDASDEEEDEEDDDDDEDDDDEIDSS